MPSVAYHLLQFQSQFLIEIGDDFFDVDRQSDEAFGEDVVWDFAVVGCRYASGYGSLRVGIPSVGHSQTDCRFIIGALQEGDNRFRN